VVFVVVVVMVEFVVVVGTLMGGTDIGETVRVKLVVLVVKGGTVIGKVEFVVVLLREIGETTIGETDIGAIEIEVVLAASIFWAVVIAWGDVDVFKVEFCLLIVAVEIVVELVVFTVFDKLVVFDAVVLL